MRLSGGPVAGVLAHLSGRVQHQSHRLRHVQRVVGELLVRSQFRVLPLQTRTAGQTEPLSASPAGQTEPLSASPVSQTELSASPTAI